MKAILVIDVPVNYTEDFGHMDIRANIKVEAYNDLDFKPYELQYIEVNPLPQRKKSLIVADGDGVRFEEQTEFEQGYNSCLDEILGEWNE